MYQVWFNCPRGIVPKLFPQCFDTVVRATGKESGRLNVWCWFVGGDILTIQLELCMTCPVVTNTSIILHLNEVG